MDELLEKVNNALSEVYEEEFTELEEAVEALIEEYHEAGEEDEDEDVEEDDKPLDRYYQVEHAQPMTELDRALQMDERHLQLERAIQIERQKLQKLKEEDEDVSHGADHEEQVQSMSLLEIDLQIAERALQIEERKIQNLDDEENEALTK